MGSSSVTSDIFFAVALLAICGVVLLVLRYYTPLRSTPSYITIPVFLAVALPASIALLVPIDIASRAEEDDGDLRGIWLPERVILVSWRILYWLTFVLTWAILPILGEYADSGYREPKAKLLYSLRSNGRYWAIMAGASILGAVYFFLSSGFHFYSLKMLVVALAYAWGLIMAIYLMGHGLVALPRRLYRNASVSNRLRIIQSHAPRLHERLMDALDQLEKYEEQVMQLRQRKSSTSREFQQWIDELSDGASLLESAAPVTSGPTSTVPPVITERYLAELTRKVKRARHRKVRFVDEWDYLVHSAKNTQAILDSTSSHKLEFPYSDPHHPFHKVRISTPYIRYLIHVHVMPVIYYALSGFLSLAAVLVIWSSIVKSFDTKLSLIGWSIVHHRDDSSRSQIGLAGQLIAASWLVYMCAVAMYSVTEVKIWGNRALVRRGTYPESATWYASQLAKLSVPLAYNFITFLPGKIYRNTMFHKFLGKLIVLTPLGDAFQSFFPMLILVPVLMTLFGVYRKVKNIFGFGGDMIEDDADEAPEHGTSSTWREGRALIDREVHSTAGVGGSNTVGLAQRGGPDRQRAATDRYQDEPASNRTLPAESAATARTRLERATRQARMQEEEEGGGFFEDLGSRIRNTFDGMERPRWMGGPDEDNTAEPQGGWFAGLSNNNESGNSGGNQQGGLRRWFGGGGNEGRVRL